MTPRGGEFIADNIKDPALWITIRAIANEVIKEAKKYFVRLPDIYFGFILNGTLNAVAFPYNKRYFIGVNFGTIYLFNTVFCRMLSDRRVLTSIGDISKESEQHQSLVGLINNSNKAFSDGITPERPNCPIRDAYRSLLLEETIQFLVTHEVAHISNGHVDYVNIKHGLSFLFELGAAQDGTTVQDILTRQTLEMDADAQMCSNLIANATSYKTEKTPTTIEQSVFRRVFSVCSFFRMFGDTRFSNELKRYPHQRLRQVLALDCIRDVIGHWPTGQKESCTIAVQTAVDEVESAFSLLMKSEPSIDGLEEASGIVGRAHINKLKEHFKTVTIPAIKPYAYFDYDKLTAGWNSTE
jgi:hypothetical protein